MSAYSPRGSLRTVVPSSSTESSHLSPRTSPRCWPQPVVDSALSARRHCSNPPDNKVRISCTSAGPTCDGNQDDVGVVRAFSTGRVGALAPTLDIKELRKEVEDVRRQLGDLQTLMDSNMKDLRRLCEVTTRKVGLALVETAEKRLEAAEKRFQEEMVKEITSRTAMMMKACEAVEACLKQEISSAQAIQRDEIEAALKETISGALDQERTSRRQDMADFQKAVIACVNDERVARLESFASLSTYIMACRLTPAVNGTGEESPPDVCIGRLSSAAGMLQETPTVPSSAHEKAPSAMQQSSTAFAEERSGPEIAIQSGGAGGSALCTIQEEQEISEIEWKRSNYSNMGSGNRNRSRS